ncbi:MAG: hypothetical protein QXP27_04825 [Candidatus Methanomethyliaceae archaeon]
MDSSHLNIVINGNQIDETSTLWTENDKMIAKFGLESTIWSQ